MLASHMQVVVCFEEHGMSPEEIAADQELEVAAVKAILMQESSAYRKDAKKNPDHLNFTDSEDEEMKGIILDCARAATLPDGSVDHRTRLKAATYIRDDRRGRLEPARLIQKGPTFNLMQINQSIQQARSNAERMKAQLLEPKTAIEIEGVPA